MMPLGEKALLLRPSNSAGTILFTTDDPEHSGRRYKKKLAKLKIGK